ncbi:MAG: serine hydrolase [Marinilabiliales bacterium]
MIALRYLILTLLIIPTVLLSQQYKKELNDIDDYIKKSMKEWEIPGLAIGIVKDDSLIFAKGYGVRDINKGGKVDENTVFGIASNTKAFTVAALAMLVEDKQINWDDPVIKYLPYFEMYDPYVTKEMRIRDLLCHRAGYKTFAGDLLWHSTNYSREDIIKRIKYLKPTYSFRYHYGYSNLMFLTAGEIIPAVTGISYDDFLKTKIFEPLGMTRTNTSIKTFDKIENLAYPHDKKDGKTIRIKYISWDNIAPAGGINSCVTDMSKWIKLQLNHGIYKNNKYFSKESQKVMWTPHTVEELTATDEYLFPSMHFNIYGLGWDMFDYHGRKIVNHSGGLDGMISQLALVPEENLGFVVLTNSMNYLPYALMFKILDIFFHEDGKDYSSIFFNYYQQNKNYKENLWRIAESSRDAKSKPSFPLEKYTGTYKSELYGNAIVSIENKKLKVQFVPAPEFVSTLEHWENDTFVIEFKAFPSLPKGLCYFISDESDTDVRQMKIEIDNPDFDFTELEFFKVKDE